uniref:Mitochondrial proton/calcium exchanger protein n=1 Tax=Palpitomonas bilix TaxID=652834 RepID=A0A7S3G7J0_9EUKA|mmetsp:Transcript_27962/g.71133  ORF Transcript_27962/g.71133 Transcript_27962/m.71133 type:complete len:753 (+) Transcript_27962:97-2355(+)
MLRSFSARAPGLVSLGTSSSLSLHASAASRCAALSARALRGGARGENLAPLMASRTLRRLFSEMQSESVSSSTTNPLSMGMGKQRLAAVKEARQTVKRNTSSKADNGAKKAKMDESSGDVALSKGAAEKAAGQQKSIAKEAVASASSEATGSQSSSVGFFTGNYRASLMEITDQSLIRGATNKSEMSTLQRVQFGWKRGWAKVVEEARHYWTGTKLLFREVQFGFRTLRKILDGHTMTWRERRQFLRTVGDLVRLGPVFVFLVIPFMEVLLPFALKLFPNMLPSTFHAVHKKEEDLKRELRLRLELARFLQETLESMADSIAKENDGSLRDTAAEFTTFMENVRNGQKVSNEDILRFSKLFDDEIALDTLPRTQLVSMCRFLNINPYGTDALLRILLRARLQELKADDELMRDEDIAKLSLEELKVACSARGIRTQGLSPAGYRRRLKEWLELSLDHSVPASLLIMSRVFTITERMKTTKAIEATLQSLPEDVYEGLELPFKTSDRSSSVKDKERKLENFIRQEELIAEEEEEIRKYKKMEEEMEKKEKLETRIADGIPAGAVAEDGKVSTATVQETAGGIEGKPLAVETEDVEIPQEKLRALGETIATLSSASSVAREKEMLKDMIEDFEDLQSLLKDSKGGISTSFIGRVDSMLKKLSSHVDHVDLKIGDKLYLLDLDKDGKLSTEELKIAVSYKFHPVCPVGPSLMFCDAQVKEVIREYNTEAEAAAVARQVSLLKLSYIRVPTSPFLA